MKAKAILCLIAFALIPSHLYAQGSTFTYQGRLAEGGSAATGLYDLRFAVHDALLGGSQIGPTITNAATEVSNGLFQTTLDFGAGVFTGADRWIEIGVRANGGDAFVALAPRQQITSTPYAVRAANFAGSVAASQITGTLNTNHIAAGTITSTMLATGSVTRASIADGAVSLDQLDADAVPLGMLHVPNPTPRPTEYFGESLAALGSNFILVGAPIAAGVGALVPGEAYLFNASGVLVTTFASPTPSVYTRFGASVAALGTGFAIIGAPLAEKAYLFATNGTLVTTITNPAGLGSFGSAVAAVGTDKILVGAMDSDLGASRSGAAHLFATNGTLLVTFTNPAPSVDDLFGITVRALGPDRVVIGARLADEGAGNAGAAYLYATAGPLLATFVNPTPNAADNFGTALAALGSDRVLIGASADGSSGQGSGVAYLFDTNGNRLMTFRNPQPTSGDFFGAAVAAVGTDKVLVGAFWDDAGATDAGSAYLFNTNGVLLLTIPNPMPGFNEFFGAAVGSLGDSRIVISCSQDTVSGFARAGSIYIFDAQPGASMDRLIASGVQAGAITAAMMGNEVGVWSRAGSNLFYLNGNVGVGTNAPATKLQVNGIVAANSFWGEGSGLSGLNASELGSGIVPSGRLAGVYSGLVSFTSAANQFFGNGAGLTGLDAAQLASGTVSDARLSGNIARRDASNTFSGNQVVNGRLEAAANWDGDHGALELTGDKPSVRLNGGAIAGNQSWLLHVGSDGPGNLGLFQRAGASNYVNHLSLTPTGHLGLGNSNPTYDLQISGAESRIRLDTTNAANYAVVEYGTDVRSWHTGVGGSAALGGLNSKYYVYDANAGQTRMVVDSTGNVGIGTTTPGALLEVNGTAAKPGGGGWAVSSDARLKKNVRPLAGALGKLLALRGVSFEYIDPEQIRELPGERMGLIAQEVEKVIPDWVETGSDGYKRMTVRGLEALVVEALRELDHQSKARETEIESLKKRLALLEKALGQISRASN